MFMGLGFRVTTCHLEDMGGGGDVFVWDPLG